MCVKIGEIYLANAGENHKMKLEEEIFSCCNNINSSKFTSQHDNYCPEHTNSVACSSKHVPLYALKMDDA